MELIRRARGVLEGHPDVHDAYLFGSHARGTAGPLSDVDLAVYVDSASLARPGFGVEAELGRRRSAEATSMTSPITPAASTS
jgi:predicted nucleotidyltransferase